MIDPSNFGSIWTTRINKRTVLQPTILKVEVVKNRWREVFDSSYCWQYFIFCSLSGKENTISENKNRVIFVETDQKLIVVFCLILYSNPFLSLFGMEPISFSKLNINCLSSFNFWPSINYSFHHFASQISAYNFGYLVFVEQCKNNN